MKRALKAKARFYTMQKELRQMEIELKKILEKRFAKFSNRLFMPGITYKELEGETRRIASNIMEISEDNIAIIGEKALIYKFIKA